MGENRKTITGGREERSKCEEKEKDGGGGEAKGLKVHRDGLFSHALHLFFISSKKVECEATPGGVHRVMFEYCFEEDGYCKER